MLEFLAQTTHEGPTWTQFFSVLGIASGVPSVLLGWLHVRLNGIADQSEKQIDSLRSDMEDQIKYIKVSQEDGLREARSAYLASEKAIYGHLGHNYIQKGELDAKLETISTSIQAVGDRVADFMELFRSLDDKQREGSERLTRIEAVCQEKHRNES